MSNCNTNETDLRVIKTSEAIKKAFLELICELPFEKITVAELCRRALINKKTFYTHFETLDNLLAEIQAGYISGYVERIKCYALPDDLAAVNREFFVYSAAQDQAYEKITCSSTYNHIRQDMIDQVVAASWHKSKKYRRLSKFEAQLLMSFTHAISVDCYRLWVDDGKKIPLDEIIELSNRLMCHGVNGLFGSHK